MTVVYPNRLDLLVHPFLDDDARITAAFKLPGANFGELPKEEEKSACPYKVAGNMRNCG